MYNSAPNCKGTFLRLESGECAPSLLSQVGAGWVFSSYKLNWPLRLSTTTKSSQRFSMELDLQFY